MRQFKKLKSSFLTKRAKQQEDSVAATLSGESILPNPPNDPIVLPSGVTAYPNEPTSLSSQLTTPAPTVLSSQLTAPAPETAILPNETADPPSQTTAPTPEATVPSSRERREQLPNSIRPMSDHNFNRDFWKEAVATLPKEYKPIPVRRRRPEGPSSTSGIPIEYMERVPTPPAKDLASQSAISASALAILTSRVTAESQEDVVEGNADDAAGVLGNSNRPKDDGASKLALGLTTGQGSAGRQPLEGITENKAGLTFGEMTKRVTVSPQQKEEEENDTVMKWLVASQGVLTAVKDIPGGVTTATGANAVIGPLIGILKLIESDLTIDDKWNKARDTLKTHLDYVQREIGANTGATPQASDSPRERLTRAYAKDLSTIFEAYLEGRGVDKEDLAQGRFTKIVGYWNRTGRALTSTVYIKKIDGLLARMTEALQHYERNKTTYIVDVTYKLLHANIDRLLRPNRSDAQQPEANGRQHATCHGETRKAILSDIRAWASSAEGPNFYLLTDAAGLGKSTVASTLAHERRDTSLHLGANFFFSRGNNSTSSPLDFMRHIAWSLMQSYPQVKHHESLSYDSITKALESRSIDDQWERLVSIPLSILCNEARITGHQIVLIIDALDECAEDQRDDLLRRLLTLPKGYVKVFMTSRPGYGVEDVFDDKTTARHGSLEQLDTNSQDLATYVKDRFEGMKMTLEEAEKLSNYSGGLFILASTICDLLQKSLAKKKLLKHIIEKNDQLAKPANRKLERLYLDILQPHLDRDICTKDMIQNIFRVILAASCSLSVAQITALMPSADDVDVDGVAGVITQFSSVLQCSTNRESPVYVRHPTFREFMLESAASHDYGVTLESAHVLLASSCISVMVKDLCKNICHIDENASFKDAQSSLDLACQLQDHVHPAVLYALSDWAFHSVNCVENGAVQAQIQILFETKLLNLIEACTIGRLVAELMHNLHELQLVIKNSDNASSGKYGNITRWCHDALEFLRENQALLSEFPLQVYLSSLTFTPRESWIHQHYAQESLPKIPIGHPTRASSALVLRGHKSPLTAVAYSADGRSLVSAAQDGGLIFWDTQTGAKQSELKLGGDEDMGIAVGLSPVGEWLLAIWGRWAIMNGTGRIDAWRDVRVYCHNLRTGSLICPGEYLSVYVKYTCSSWTSDFNTLACGSKDGQIQLFSLREPPLKPIGSIKAHSRDEVTSLSFSHDGLMMASTSGKTIKIWEMSSGVPAVPIAAWKHTEYICKGAFSPINSSLFALVDGWSLYIYNIHTLSIDLSFRCGMLTWILAYSHNGKKIATAAYPSTIYIVSTCDRDGNGRPVTREFHSGHLGDIWCLAFSPDDRHLVTGGKDNTLRIHDLEITHPQFTTTRRSRPTNSFSYSLSGRLVIAADEYRHVRIYDVESGEVIGDIEDDAYYPKVAMSSDGSIFARGNVCQIELWIVDGLRRILTIGVPYGPRFYAMTFSPDHTKLAVMLRQSTFGKRHQILILDVINAYTLTNSDSVTINFDLNALGPIELLGFHPSGGYICLGNRAWDLSSTPPASLIGDQLGTILQGSFFLRFDGRASPSPSISLGSPPRQVLYLPPDIKVMGYAVYNGRIALGSERERMVIDFTHLATEEEKALLERTDAMRSAAAVRSGPNRLYEVLSSYTGPSRIFVPVDWPKEDSVEGSDRNDEDEDGVGTEDEDEDQSDVESHEDKNGQDDGEDEISEEDGGEDVDVR